MANDAIALLKKDHANVKALFDEICNLGDRASASRAKLFQKIAQELDLHTRVEETIFYPAVKEAAKRDPEARDLVLEAFTEHALVKTLIADIQSLESADENYRPKISVLVEMVLQHIQEEEKELFPHVKRICDQGQLREMGDQILEMKEQAGAPVR